MRLNAKYSLGTTLIVGVGLVSGGLSDLMNTNQDDSKQRIKPLDRNEKYELFSLKKYFDVNEFEQSFVKTCVTDKKYFKTIDESSFKENFPKHFIKTLEKISRFKNKAKEYCVDVHYSFYDGRKIMIDVVWGIEKSKYFFYDQLKIYLS